MGCGVEDFFKLGYTSCFRVYFMPTGMNSDNRTPKTCGLPGKGM